MIIIYKNKVAVMDCILSPIQSYTEPISVYDRNRMYLYMLIIR